MKISQHPQTGCTHTSRNYRDYRPDSPQTLRPDSICSFRDECDPSSRGARRPVPHTLVTGTQFVTSNTQGLGKLDFHVLGQRDLAPFDASDYLGRNLRSSAELRLGQPSQNAPVTREPLCDRHLNDVLDRDAQLGRHTRPRRSTWGDDSRLPTVERCQLPHQLGGQVLLERCPNPVGRLQDVRE